jgi:hypothetical protein
MKLGWKPVRDVALLFGPILAFFALDAFVLPVNTFTFREWEAVTFSGSNDPNYAFYPNMTITQKEYGDKYRYSTYIQPRTTTWVVDSLGYRNREAYDTGKHYCFVTIGDSNTIGSSFDQHEMLAELLERKSGCRSYNAAALDITRRFFQKDEFRASPPDYLVFQTIAGHFYNDSVFSILAADGQLPGITPAPSAYQRRLAAFYGWLDHASPRVNASVLQNIMDRMAGYNFVRARLGITDLPPRVAGQYNEFRNINSSTGAQTGPTIVGEARYRIASAATYKQSCPETVLQIKDEPTRLASCRFIAIFEAMSEALRERGTKLIVLLQPSGDLLLEPAIGYLRSKGERIAEFPVSQQLPFGIDMDFYWAADDTHWVPRGAELAADMIVAESQGKSSEALLKSRQPAIAAFMRELIAK